MPLTEKEKDVIATKVMRFSEKKALEYLKEKGHLMSKSTYYRILGRVSSETSKRLFEICKNMKERHILQIDELETIRTEMWKNYNKCDDPLDKVKILKEIRELIVYISAFDDSTALVIQEVIRNFGKDHENPNLDLSSLDDTETQKETENQDNYDSDI